MPGPWEKYQNDDSGPWSKYGQDASAQAAPTTPNKMSDEQIATQMLGMSPDQFKKMASSKDYRPGMLAGGFTDPESITGRDLGKTALGRLAQRSLFGVQGLVSPPQNIESSWIGRTASGARKGFNAVAQLVSKARNDDGATELLYRALGKVNELNSQQKPNGAGGIPEAVGQAIPALMLTRRLGAPLGAVAGPIAESAAGAYLTTPGNQGDRLKAGGTAAAVSGAMTGIGRGASALWAKTGARDTAAAIGRSKKPTEIMDELSGGKFGPDDIGEYAQNASTENLRAAQGLVSREGYGLADELAPTMESDLGNYLPTVRDIVAKRRLAGIRPDEMPYFKDLLKNAEDSVANSQEVPRTLDQLMEVYQEMSPMIRKQSLGNGSRASLDALGSIRNAIDADLASASPSVQSSFQAGQSGYAGTVGPHKTPWLTGLRDSTRPNDYFQKLAQSKMSDTIPGDLAQEVAVGTGPEPILYQYMKKAIMDSTDRPGGFVQSLRKTVPTAQQISPEVGQQFADALTTAKTADTLGTVANWGTGGTMALAGALKPSLSGPGMVWKALQTQTGRDIATLLGKVPDGSPAQEQLLQKFLALEAGQRMQPRDDGFAGNQP